MEEFKSWLKEDINDQFSFHFSKCRKSYYLSNMGITSLLSHIKSKKPNDRVKAVQLNYEINSFLKPSFNKKLHSNQSIPTTSDCANISLKVCLN